MYWFVITWKCLFRSVLLYDIWRLTVSNLMLIASNSCKCWKVKPLILPLSNLLQVDILLFFIRTYSKVHFFLFMLILYILKEVWQSWDIGSKTVILIKVFQWIWFYRYVWFRFINLNLFYIWHKGLYTMKWRSNWCCFRTYIR